MSHLSSESITTAFLVSSRTRAWPLLSFNGHPRRIRVPLLSITPVSLLFTSFPRRASKTYYDRFSNDPWKETLATLAVNRFTISVMYFYLFEMQRLIESLENEGGNGKDSSKKEFR